MSTVSQKFEDQFGSRARQIDAKFRQDVQAILQDGTLSDLGKQQAIARATDHKNGAVGKLRQEADLWLKYERRDAEADAMNARRAAVENKRKVLGDQVLAAIYEKQLAMLEPDEVLQAYKTAAPGWEQTIVREYGRLALQAHARSNPPDAITARRMLAELDGDGGELAAAEDALRTIDRDGGAWLDRLDQHAYKQDLSVKLGVQADALELDTVA